MIANIVLIAFLGFMAYWWANQGLFSALLHMLCVICAGALALAVWEPLTVKLLLGLIPNMAWGLGLLLPFILLLLILRKVADRVILGNVHFISLVNLIGGAIFGLASGILTAGITILGLSFMDVGPTVGGYQPYALDERGRVIESGEDLWLAVDRQTAGFYSLLSGGAFTSGRPLKQYRPDLPQLAAIYRLHADHNASLAASPEAVSIAQWYQAPTPLNDSLEDDVLDAVAELDSRARSAGHQLVAVETHWQQGAKGVYDEDGTLRIAPAQVRLLVVSDQESGETTLVAPVGVARGGDSRQFMPFDAADLFAHTSSQQERFTWAFILPESHQPRALLVRTLRLSLSGPAEDDASQITTALGGLTPAAEQRRAAAREAATEAGDGVGARDGARTGSAAVSARLTSDLPRPISRNLGTGLNMDGEVINSGRADVRPQEGQLSRALMVTRIQTPSHRAMVRIELQRDQARSFFGAAHAAAASLATIILTDDQGNNWQPIAYVWLKQNNEQAISVNINQPIRSARELPVPDMGPNDSLYLYFHVNRNSTILNYEVGRTVQEINLQVP